jgi:hypothetical protein
MKSFVAVFFFLLGALAWADVAPTEWHGGSIKPVEGSVVTMESASVEIQWGTPCTLRAVFVMNNPSDSPQEVLVGFPMHSGDAWDMAPDPLTISFNGGSAEKMAASGEMEHPLTPKFWMWHTHKHSFAPGKTVVEVNTVLRASLLKGGTPYEECLLYCIESGGKWAGEIGAEDVAIVFPSAIRDDQIVEAKPAGAKIEGNRVSWSFKNFKPKGNEFDVKLIYARPDVLDKIEQLRNEHKQQPQSATAAIKLAKHLLALTDGYSNSGFPPWRLTQEEYTETAMLINSEKDRQTFANHYMKKEDGLYWEVSREWTNERASVVQILAVAGYRDRRSQSSRVKEGESLLLDVLKKHPRNAKAWNVYLANYWRFAFASYGHWSGMTFMTKKQADLIKEAVKNCPEDECIGLWGRVGEGASKEWNERNRYDLLQETIDKKGYRDTEFPRVEYGYY